MKAIFMTSGPSFSYKNEKGNNVAIKLENKELVDNLKKEIEDYNNILLVCSSPDDYEKNDKYSQIIVKSLSLSGFKFNMSDVLDSRNALFARSLILNSDLVVFMGGNPLEQISFFNDIEMKDILKRYKGVLLGVSAGTMNMADKAYCSKDGDVENSVYYKGLGLTDINVEPHFDVNDEVRIKEVLLKDSGNKPFIALPNESFIVCKKEECKLYGDAYYFSEGKYTKTKEIRGNKGA